MVASRSVAWVQSVGIDGREPRHEIAAPSGQITSDQLDVLRADRTRTASGGRSFDRWVVGDVQGEGAITTIAGDKPEGRAAAINAVELDECDVVAFGQHPDPHRRDGRPAGGAAGAVREWPGKIARIHIGASLAERAAG
jgi:hypothetical protein